MKENSACISAVAHGRSGGGVKISTVKRERTVPSNAGAHRSTPATCFVVPFYNGDKYIRSCLESISGNTDFSLEVLIVNNSDRPTDVHRIAEDFRNVIVIDSEPHIGFGKAANIGARAAIQRGADYVICLNQDSIADKDLIKELLKPFRENTDTVMVSPIIYTYDFKEIEPFFVRWYLVQCPGILRDALNNNLKSYYDMLFTSGACFAIKAEFISEFGFFDPLYFMYFEDEDLCRRIRYLGYRVVVAPNAKVAHHHSHTNCDNTGKEMIIFWQRQSFAVYMLKDVKLPLASAFLRMEMKLLSTYMRLLPRLRLREIFKNLFADIRLHLSLPRILNSRRTESRYSGLKSGSTKERSHA